MRVAVVAAKAGAKLARRPTVLMSDASAMREKAVCIKNTKIIKGLDTTTIALVYSPLYESAVWISGLLPKEVERFHFLRREHAVVHADVVERTVPKIAHDI
jgi:hypothetical protein